METYIVQADSKTAKALVAVFKALNVSYKKKSTPTKKDSLTAVQEAQNPYDPAFVKKIMQRSENARKGDVIEYTPALKKEWFGK